MWYIVSSHCVLFIIAGLTRHLLHQRVVPNMLEY